MGRGRSRGIAVLPPVRGLRVCWLVAVLLITVFYSCVRLYRIVSVVIGDRPGVLNNTEACLRYATPNLQLYRGRVID